MYHEDLDLGWRISLAGFKNMLVVNAVVYHQYEFSRSIKKLYYMERNRLLTIMQNYCLATLLLILPALILAEMGLWLFAFKNGWFKEKARSYAYFFYWQNWTKMLKQRQRVNKLRKRSDRQVCWNFSGRISHQEVGSLLVNYVINPLVNLYWQAVKNLLLW